MNGQLLDLFFRACEFAGLPELKVGREPRPRVLRHPFAVVGSDPGCDLVIADPTISPRHCYLQAIGSKVLCVDLGGEGGVNPGQGPVSAAWIEAGRSLRIGGREVRLGGSAAGSDDDRRTEPGRGGQGLDAPLLTRLVPKAVLEFQSNHIKTRWRMRRVVALVGCAPECTVRLQGVGVAKYHCALVLTGLGLWVVDLLGGLESGGSGGVSVNGKPVRFARLDPGDVLKVGEFSVTVSHARESDRRPRQSAQGPTAEVETTGSGEIELSGRGQVLPPGSPPFKTALELETLRREYEDRLDEQAEQYRVEVESLRHEIDYLRDVIEEIRPASPARLRPKARHEPSRPIPPTNDPRPRDARARTLGTATRGVNPGPPASPPRNPHGHEKPLTPRGLGVLATDRPDLAADTTLRDDFWLPYDGGMVAPSYDNGPLH